MPELSWRHHTLIQALLSRGPLVENDFHDIFQGIAGKNPVTNQKLFSDILLKINKELGFLQFELRGCRHQYDGNVYYGVVNNVADEQSKLGTKYTVPQIAFYKGIIEAIVNDATAQGSISSIGALNIRLGDQFGAGSSSQNVPTAFKTFTISQKEKTIEELVRDRWLSSMPDGDIGLGVRSFLDLRSWFRNNEVPSCEVCNEAAVKAELCEKEGCNVRIHQYCLIKKFSQIRAERVCPGCGAPWHCPFAKQENEDCVDPVGRDCDPGPSTSTQRKRRLKTENPFDDNDDQAPNRSTSRKTRRRLRSGVTLDADDTNGSAPSQVPVRTTRSSARLSYSPKLEARLGPY